MSSKAHDEEDLLRRLIKDALDVYFDKVLEIEKGYLYAKNPLMERIRERKEEKQST